MGCIDSLLGLAKKAGRLQSGEYCTEKSVKGGLSSLVILAGDASDNTKKKFHNMCTFYETKLIEYSSKELLGAAIGTDLRSVISIEDEGFAKAMDKKIRQAEAKPMV